MTRLLRIATSVFFAIWCVAFLSLWIRSDRWWDRITVPISPSLYLGGASVPGQCGFGLGNPNQFIDPLRTIVTEPAEKSAFLDRHGTRPHSIWGRFEWDPFGFFGFWIPYWFLVPTAAAFSVFPWLRWTWRFSIRAMLTVITLAAMLLGLNAVLSR